MRSKFEMKMVGNQLKNSVSNVISRAIIDARKNGIHIDAYSLLGYVYKTVAGENANPDVLNILNVDTFNSSIFSQEKLDILVQEPLSVYEYILEIAGKDSILQIPNEVCYLILNADRAVMTLGKGETIYTPFAGLSDFAAHFPSCHFVGEEKNLQTWALGEVKSYFSHKNTKITCEDFLHKKEKYDNIIATPPFGLQGEYAIHKIIDNLYDRLNPGGNMVVIVPPSFLFETRSNELRRKLILEHALTEVILLPSHLFKYTGIATAILSLHKPMQTKYECLIPTENGQVLAQGDLRTEEYPIRLTDYSSFIKDNRRYGTIYKLDVESIDDAEFTSVLKYITESEKPSNFSVLISSFDLLTKEQINLDPKFYLNDIELFGELKDNETLLPLRDLLSVYLGTLSEGKNEARKVCVSNLSDNILKGKNDFLDLNIENISDAVYKIVDEPNVLLIARLGEKLKPTIFQPSGELVVLDRNVLAFKLKRNVNVSMEYLQSQLAQDYFIKQLKTAHSRAGMSSLNQANFLECKIKVIGLQEQHDKVAALQLQAERVREIKEQISQEMLEQLGIENKALRDARHNDFVRLMRVRKHAMGQVLNELDPGLDLILNKIQQSPLSCDTVVSRKSGTTALRQLEILRAQLDVLIGMTNNLTDEHQYGTPEVVAIHEFLMNFVASCSQENFRFDVSQLLNIDSDIQSCFNIDIATSDLTKVLNNIIANAKEKGFTDNERDYIIRFLIDRAQLGQKDAVKITIVNNGNPLPMGFDEQRVFTLGESSTGSTGIGGWEIKNIVDYYGGEVHIENNTGDGTDGFTVAYVITLPLTDKRL